METTEQKGPTIETPPVKSFREIVESAFAGVTGVRAKYKAAILILAEISDASPEAYIGFADFRTRRAARSGEILLDLPTHPHIQRIIQPHGAKVVRVKKGTTGLGFRLVRISAKEAADAAAKTVKPAAPEAVQDIVDKTGGATAEAASGTDLPATPTVQLILENSGIFWAPTSPNSLVAFYFARQFDRDPAKWSRVREISEALHIDIQDVADAVKILTQYFARIGFNLIQKMVRNPDTGFSMAAYGLKNAETQGKTAPPKKAAAGNGTNGDPSGRKPEFLYVSRAAKAAVAAEIDGASADAVPPAESVDEPDADIGNGAGGSFEVVGGRGAIGSDVLAVLDAGSRTERASDDVLGHGVAVVEPKLDTPLSVQEIPLHHKELGGIRGHFRDGYPVIRTEVLRDGNNVIQYTQPALLSALRRDEAYAAEQLDAGGEAADRKAGETTRE